MILGNLFDNIIKNNISVLITSNTSPENLYKDGLQRDQFLPFIKIIENNRYISELRGNLDFRKKDITQIDRFSHRIIQLINLKLIKYFTPSQKIEKN